MRVAEEVVVGDVPTIRSGHKETDQIADPRACDGHIARQYILGRAELSSER